MHFIWIVVAIVVLPALAEAETKPTAASVKCTGTDEECVRALGELVIDDAKAIGRIEQLVARAAKKRPIDINVLKAGAKALDAIPDIPSSTFQKPLARLRAAMKRHIPRAPAGAGPATRALYADIAFALEDGVATKLAALSAAQASLLTIQGTECKDLGLESYEAARRRASMWRFRGRCTVTERTETRTVTEYETVEQQVDTVKSRRTVWKQEVENYVCDRGRARCTKTTDVPGTVVDSVPIYGKVQRPVKRTQTQRASELTIEGDFVSPDGQSFPIQLVREYPIGDAAVIIRDHGRAELSREFEKAVAAAAAARARRANAKRKPAEAAEAALVAMISGERSIDLENIVVAAHGVDRQTVLTLLHGRSLLADPPPPPPVAKAAPPSPPPVPAAPPPRPAATPAPTDATCGGIPSDRNFVRLRFYCDGFEAEAKRGTCRMTMEVVGKANGQPIKRQVTPTAGKVCYEVGEFFMLITGTVTGDVAVSAAEHLVAAFARREMSEATTLQIKRGSVGFHNY